MSLAEHVAGEARRAVAEAMSASYERRRFTVSKFGRHPDGFLHARVVVEGMPFYFHRMYGSWLAPGQVGLRTVLKEPEALLGSALGREVKYDLAEKARTLEYREQKEQERNAAAARTPDDAGGNSPPAGDDRLLAEGDRGDTPAEIQPDGAGDT